MSVLKFEHEVFLLTCFSMDSTSFLFEVTWNKFYLTFEI
jgi:hypothetical protein